MRPEITPERVSWLDWDTWELVCTCGESITMKPGPKPKNICPNPECGISWIMTRGFSWTRTGDDENGIEKHLAED